MNRLNNKKNKSKKNKSKKNKSKKNKSKKSLKKYGGTVLGLGKDGCIIDSISCGDLSQDKFVAKFLYNGRKINTELNKELQRIDPNSERYNYYYMPDYNKCYKTDNFDQDFSTCSKNGSISTSNIVFQHKLYPIDSKKMTREQYRFLRHSIQKLHDNNISHGDLPDNVMLNPNSNMPVIIDWEEGKIGIDVLDKQIDYNAFLNNFKVSN